MPRATVTDRWTIGYAIVAATILAVRRPDSGGAVLVAAHACVVVLALSMPAARRRGRLGATLGDWYPLVILPALYTAIGVANVADGRSHDGLVQRWEAALFGFQPAYAWIRHEVPLVLARVLLLGYLVYYPIVAGAPLALWLTGRREGMRRVVRDVFASFAVCYVVFLLFPVAGPRYVFPPADTAATHTEVARAIAMLLDAAAAWGTAFPSSHVAAAATATLAAWREWRGLGVVLMPPTVLLALGTVYGQFHYGVDVLGGLVVAGAVWLVSRRVRTV